MIEKFGYSPKLVGDQLELVGDVVRGDGCTSIAFTEHSQPTGDSFGRCHDFFDKFCCLSRNLTGDSVILFPLAHTYSTTPTLDLGVCGMQLRDTLELVFCALYLFQHKCP